MLRSPHGHAKIKSIDSAAAKAAPGVLAVITAADWKAAGLGDLPVARRPQAPRRLADVQAALSGAGRRPRALGRRPVAFVVAETSAQALDAAELIEVDYEPLPAVTSTAEATEARRRRRSGTAAPTISASSN